MVGELFWAFTPNKAFYVVEFSETLLFEIHELLPFYVAINTILHCPHLLRAQGLSWIALLTVFWDEPTIAFTWCWGYVQTMRS